jgi:hypothetical protein
MTVPNINFSNDTIPVLLLQGTRFDSVRIAGRVWEGCESWDAVDEVPSILRWLGDVSEMLPSSVAESDPMIVRDQLQIEFLSPSQVDELHMQIFMDIWHLLGL